LLGVPVYIHVGECGSDLQGKQGVKVRATVGLLTASRVVA